MKIKPFHLMFVALMLPLSVAACGSVAPAEGKTSDELSAEGATAEAQDSLLGLPNCVAVPNPCDLKVLDDLVKLASNLGLPLCQYEICPGTEPVACDTDNLLPYPNDCEKFIQCDAGGVPVVKTCPEGTEFDADRQVCDWPENAGCSQAPPPSSP